MERLKSLSKKRDIIVIGASAGGLPALMELVKGLPGDLPAAIFIVLHLAPYSTNYVPEILSKLGPLAVVEPTDGEPIQYGRIYVAAPDHHLLLEKGKIIIKKGPKENRFRPSIDALFRSASFLYGPRVIGVVLSGMLDDGTSGLWSVKRMGGLAIIQDPLDAAFPAMPANVLEYVAVDYQVPVAQLAALLVGLIGDPTPKKPTIPAKELNLLEMEIVIATHDNAFQMGIIQMGELTPFTCPECHGALTQLKEGKIMRFRCHTGHAFTISALLAEVTESVEDQLWQAMRGLEESNMLLDKLGQHFTKEGQAGEASLFINKARLMARQARVIHDAIFAQQTLSADLRLNKKHQPKKAQDR